MNSQILLLRAQKLLTVIRGHLRSGVCIRGSASKASVAKPSVDAAVRSNVQFKHVIYRFKHIQAFQTLSLFKLGQTGKLAKIYCACPRVNVEIWVLQV